MAGGGEPRPPAWPGPGWWRRWPPLPVPDEALWRFRMETAYGGSGEAVPEAADVVSFIALVQHHGPVAPTLTVDTCRSERRRPE